MIENKKYKNGRKWLNNNHCRHFLKNKETIKNYKNCSGHLHQLTYETFYISTYFLYLVPIDKGFFYALFFSNAVAIAFADISFVSFSRCEYIFAVVEKFECPNHS